MSEAPPLSTPLSLAALEAEVARQHALLNYPVANWVLETPGPDGRPVLDVAIIGAGMCGITAAYALKRQGITNVGLFDSAEAGLEGPWVTFARMPTLRSPKHLTGPDVGLPGLTFRAWYEAQFGAEGWDRLYKIPREQWQAYLVWMRRTLDLPVRNGVTLKGFAPAVNGSVPLLRCDLEAGGQSFATYARHLVLATGREGSGRRRFPDFVDTAALAPLVAHTADPVDFAALRGKRVAVLGAGASAFDNAATALEAGAGQVDVYMRRSFLPQINKFKAMSFRGFQHGQVALDDATRWRIMQYAFAGQTPPPHETMHRVDQHPNFHLRPGCAWRSIAKRGDHLAIETSQGPVEADFAIFGTGFSVELEQRPELEPHAAFIQRWSDRSLPADAPTSEELAGFPYLGAGFELTERTSGQAAYLSQVHVFNYGSGLSHGLLSGDIPGIEIGARRLAVHLCESLFGQDVERHIANLKAHAEHELANTQWDVPGYNF